MIRRAAVLCLILAWPTSLRSVDPPTSEVVSRAEKLYQEKRWEEVVQLATSQPETPAELDYLSGRALARLERWDEARIALERGQVKHPQDKRFPLELAGVAFKQQRYSEAKAALHRALRLDPRDIYGNDFLATIYLLEDNLEAALTYWNRIEKPYIEQVKHEPEPEVDSAILDRAFAFPPAGVLALENLRTTRARLNELGVFRQYRFDLEPVENGGFDVTFRSAPRRSWGDGKLSTLLSLGRGLPFQTVYPEFYNLGGSAMNLRSLLRWDAQKRRAFADFSAPLGGEPQWRYGVHIDLRDEKWDLAGAFAGSAAPVGELKMQFAEAGAGIRSRVNGRWGWSSAILVSRRRFQHQGFNEQWASEFLTDGYALKHRAQLDYELLRQPERRLTTRSGLRWDLGKMFGQSHSRFSKFESSIETRWLPQARGDDYETILGVRAGTTWGRVPFDELFQLGLERDSDLWMRGHVGTRDGRKGNAPLGRNYLLVSGSLNKIVYAGPGFSIGAGPFVDSGKITDPSPFLGAKKWLWDTGAQVRLNVFGGLGILFVYGKDLRSGRNVFYATLGR
ncbi:MAG: hypothetical protein HY508_07660 [Acidobacteria bacterium]|nr:hypothetical protein [Acidobacteriota bacterium]